MKFRLMMVGMLMVGVMACSHTPPTLSPAGQTAFKQHEVQKDLDLLRDIAQDASAQGSLSVKNTRVITKWHKSAITLVHDASLGWKAELGTELTQLKDQLPAAEYAVISKYVDLVRAVLKEVQ